MRKYCVTIAEARSYRIEVMVDARSADEAVKKVEVALENDIGDFPTGRGYATTDKSIKCIFHLQTQTDFIDTYGVAEKISADEVKEIEAEIEAEGGWII